jgi:ADP-ribose pyrophosphatase
MNGLLRKMLFVLVSFASLMAISSQPGRASDKIKGEPMRTLSQHQREALDAYKGLQTDHPELFKGRVVRPLVLAPDVLAAYAAEHNVVLGVAVETPYVYFINDLVESHGNDGKTVQHPYLRIVSRGQLKGGVNVVVLATIENAELGEPGSIVLVTQERHALGTLETGVPRGFGEPGLSGDANALKELREETGYIGENAQLLGTLNTDSGLTDGVVSYYHVPVSKKGAAKPEIEEAIEKVSLESRQDIWKAVRAGEIKDNFTVTALSLYEVSLQAQTAGTAKR